MVREEMEMVLGKRPRDWEEERIMEWNKRVKDMGVEMRRVLDDWAEGRGEEETLELHKEMEKVMMERRVWVKREIEVWTVEAEVRERAEREREG